MLKEKLESLIGNSDIMEEMLKKDNKEYAYDCFNKALNIGMKFKLENEFKEKIYDQKNLNQLLEMPIEGIELKQLLSIFQEEIIPYCSNFGSENFMGFPDSGNSIAGITGAILTDFLQQNLINASFCAPIATYIEIAVIKWFREILGYEIKPINSIWDVGGVITYGGTGSNAIAMLLARENFKKNTMEKGVNHASDYKIIIPKGIGHYSIKSSSMWIGCGNNVIEVETTNYKYNLKELEKALITNKGKIMCVVSYAGDSRTMTVECLAEVYQTVKKIDSNIWLHVDACHGFSLAFSEQLKEKISGIELFDSISTDPHKVLEIPYCVSTLLVKDPSKFKLISSVSDLIMQEDFAFGQITPFIGSKSWVSLKIWFLMKNLGTKKIGQMIEKRCLIAKKLAQKIIDSENFVLINKVDINSVVFMYVENKNKEIDIEKINILNEKIHLKMIEEGKFHLHSFTLNDDMGVLKKGAILHPLRFMSGNSSIDEKKLESLLNYIIKTAERVDCVE